MEFSHYIVNIQESLQPDTYFFHQTSHPGQMFPTSSETHLSKNPRAQRAHGSSCGFLGPLLLAAQVVEYPGVLREGLANGRWEWEEEAAGVPTCAGCQSVHLRKPAPRQRGGTRRSRWSAPTASFLVLKPPSPAGTAPVAQPRGSSVRNPARPRVEPPAPDAATRAPLSPETRCLRGGRGRVSLGVSSTDILPSSPGALASGTRPCHQIWQHHLGQHSVPAPAALSPWGWAGE